MSHQHPHHNKMDSHMNFRISLKDRKIVETAAKLTGFKPNTYALQKLLEVAEQDIARTNQLNSLVVSAEEWDTFVKIIEAPVKINKKLQKAVQDFNNIDISPI